MWNQYGRFQEVIERGIRSGELENGINSKALAQILVVSVIGLTVMMKSRPERSFVDNSVMVILSLLNKEGNPIWEQDLKLIKVS